uniref:Uncharacterized protein n=1 Tax=Arundo donax TaxID=35708 RepID=A0A0A9C0S7_ARUDO
MLHLFTNCTYSVDLVWDMTACWSGIQELRQQGRPLQIKQWWTDMTGTGESAKFTERYQTTYIAWNIWKERCRRIFQAKSLAITQLSHLIQQDVAAQQMARTATDF